MKIILAYTHKNEYLFIKRPEWANEVVILHDSTVPLEKHNEDQWLSVGAKIYQEPFAGDFAAHKNKLNAICESLGADYLVQLDADETLMDKLNHDIPAIVEKYQYDLIWVPRINHVYGITPEHIQKWGWQQYTIPGMAQPAINFPDYQGRIYRPSMKWVGKVHEHIQARTIMRLPMDPAYSILHTKDIATQEKQNEKYQEMMK